MSGKQTHAASWWSNTGNNTLRAIVTGDGVVSSLCVCVSGPASLPTTLYTFPSKVAMISSARVSALALRRL